MDKHELLLKLGFSDEYLDKLNNYSEGIIKIDSSSVPDEVYKVETQDNTSLVFNDVVKTYITNFKVKTF